MGGFFGITSKQECLVDVYFGVDYHSHLGTYTGGLAAWSKENGMQRRIHHITNAPFRTKFGDVFNEMSGTSAIGAISDTFPQPLLMRSSLGTFAITTVGIIKNEDELIDICINQGNSHFDAMTGGKINGTELVASLISMKSSFAEGIAYAQNMIEGTCCILILKDDGTLIAARDRLGRLPVQIGKSEYGHAVSFEAFVFEKIGYDYESELGPGEVVEITPESVTQLIAPGNEMRICAFLWSYYGYPNSTYEGSNVELMRYKNGAIMAKYDRENGIAQDIDYVGGVPDSGTPHAIGYANESGIPFGRPFIKYTPTWARSFMPQIQTERDKIAHMKQVPIDELIDGKKLLLVDDSIVRGTQLRETVQFLYDHGAKEVHMRSACPPLVFGCKYLNFSSSKSDMELIARRVIDELEGEEGINYLDEYSKSGTERNKKLCQAICDKFKFDSLEFQSLDGVIEAIGIEPCKLCTYCWSGKE